MLVVLPIVALALVSCTKSDPQEAGDNPTRTVAAPGQAASGTPTNTGTPSAAPTPGGTPVNAEQAQVKFTKCEPGKNGVVMHAEVSNETKEKRTFIITARAFNGKGESVASAALMVNALEPGGSAEAEGSSTGAVKDKKVTCEATEIQSMAM